MAANSYITGQISNLEDSIEQMFNEIGKSSEGVISDSIGIISSLVENWRTVGSVILSVVAGYGAYKAAVITMNVVQKINNMLMAEAALQQKLAAKRWCKYFAATPWPKTTRAPQRLPQAPL